jgi:hypothetical protein
MTSTTLVRTVMGSRSIHKNFLQPLLGLFSCPLSESYLSVSTGSLFLCVWCVRYRGMRIYTFFWTGSPILPNFATHLLWSRWCSSMVSTVFDRSILVFFKVYQWPFPDFVRILLISDTRRLIITRSHMSSHLVYPETNGLCSELLDGRHLFSVNNVFFSLHPLYDVHRLECVIFLIYLTLSPISLPRGTFHVSASSRFPHFCVVRPLCSFWRTIVRNVQNSLCVWDRTGLVKFCMCTVCVSFLGSSPLSRPVPIFGILHIFWLIFPV